MTRRKPITQLTSRRAIFNRMQNDKYWKRPTKRVVVAKNYDAVRIGNALDHYVGGSEIKKVKGGWQVGSKGYYHYIGS